MTARLSMLILGLVALAACGAEAVDQTAPSTSTFAPSTIANPVEAPSTSTVTPPDFTLFIAAVDAALVETSYAGAAFTDPEVFIATGQLFCELLDDGATSDEILAEHLDALAAVNVGELTESDAIATGVVLGASTEVICPEHSG